MNFREFWLGMPKADRAAFAPRVDSTLGHLNNVAYGFRPAAPDLCVRVERESEGAVTRRDLRPDDWGEIWPELICEEFPWAPVAPRADTPKAEAA